ncbi:GerAB/ArcD/ProY family transporter [Paenibacillus sp. URB8-2]|uniref:GerAB/ArcD/ProY family transporter n=1 Tax=Paenibacillus sp. URB8-2 TaxID=2741301 RepID=UPI0015C154A9|nr:GerAB/ArcD/ProY family transporter [Paenibacillus sp. URB8-2]BCG58970.1 spore germination protein KB [Paenibacillus sp. URB8-2]
MREIRIGSIHFFSLVLMFELGTALVVNVGMEAGRDAWIAIFLGCLVGMLIYTGYNYLFKLYPDLPLSGYVRAILGKPLGAFVVILYAVIFLNGAGRDLRDGSALLVMAALNRTPIIIVAAMMILSCGYVLHKGLEVLARTSFIIMIGVLMIGGVITLLMLFSGEMEWSRLQPMLGDGIKPVALSVIRSNYMFPFGEVFCFMMLMPYIGDKKRAVWVVPSAILAAGLIISYTALVNITVLGSDMVERSPFPLLSTVSKAALSDFIQRLDVLVVMLLIIGVFFKVAVYYGAAVIAISDLFNLPYRTMIIPSAIIILFSGMLDARSFVEHLEEGGEMLTFIYPVFTIVIPTILIIVAAFRNYRSGSRPG